MSANAEAEPTSVENAQELVAEPSFRRGNEGVEPLKHPSVARLRSETSSISLLESVDLFAGVDGFSTIGASDFLSEGLSGSSAKTAEWFDFAAGPVSLVL